MMMSKLSSMSDGEMRAEIDTPNRLRAYPPPGEVDQHGIEILWAPFDYINEAARIVIVGVTPGPEQALRSFVAVREAIAEGHDPSDQLSKIKSDASFRGSVIETNLKSLLEHSGAAERAGIDDVDMLWTNEAHKVHFTSTIRYPAFIRKSLYNNQIDSLAHPELRRYVETYLAAELASVPASAEIVVLGSKGPRIVAHAAKVGGVDLWRITPLPHPSGSATGAVRDFLSKTRTKSMRPCRCILCDRTRIPAGWDLTARYVDHARTHGKPVNF